MMRFIFFFFFVKESTEVKLNTQVKNNKKLKEDQNKNEILFNKMDDIRVSVRSSHK